MRPWQAKPPHMAGLSPRRVPHVPPFREPAKMRESLSEKAKVSRHASGNDWDDHRQRFRSSGSRRWRALGNRAAGPRLRRLGGDPETRACSSEIPVANGVDFASFCEPVTPLTLRLGGLTNQPDVPPSNPADDPTPDGSYHRWSANALLNGRFKFLGKSRLGRWLSTT